MSDPRDTILVRLAERLRLERPLAFLDLETTGTSAENDRIIEIAIVMVFPDGRISRYEKLVNPERPIPPEATLVHRIRDEDVRQAPTFAALAPELAVALTGCDFAGFNVGRFDLKMLAAELARVRVALDLSAARVIDSMAIYHRNERRDLAAAVRFYRAREHDGHRAAADVDATIEVLLAQLERYESLPTGLAALADYCDGRQSDWLSSDGKFAWRDGAARITFGKHSGKSLETLTKEEPGYLRWMLDKDFPSDLKALIEAAMAGRFPTRP